jgi:hypothetical protein
MRHEAMQQSRKAAAENCSQLSNRTEELLPGAIGWEHRQRQVILTLHEQVEDLQRHLKHKVRRLPREQVAGQYLDQQGLLGAAHLERGQARQECAGGISAHVSGWPWCGLARVFAAKFCKVCCFRSRPTMANTDCKANRTHEVATFCPSRKNASRSDSLQH